MPPGDATNLWNGQQLNGFKSTWPRATGESRTPEVALSAVTIIVNKLIFNIIV